MQLRQLGKAFCAESLCALSEQLFLIVLAMIEPSFLGILRVIQLVDFIPDIIVETPQSRYAALVYAKFLDGLQGLAVDCFKDWCKKNVFPTLLILLNMQKQ